MMGNLFLQRKISLTEGRGGEEFQHQTISVRVCEVKEDGDKTRKELG